MLSFLIFKLDYFRIEKVIAEHSFAKRRGYTK